MSRFASQRWILALGLIAALGVGAVVSAQRSTSAMATAASRFLASLPPDVRSSSTFSFDSPERMRWHFIPDENFPRKGITFKQMNESQRALARELMKSGLSERGYMTYSEIIQLETILRAIEDGRLNRDPENYHFTIFGTPSAQGSWGWRVEGHHVSLRFNVVNGTAVASTPSFAGANPAEVRDGPEKGKRVLALQEDSARALVIALNATQRTTAVISETAPNDILTEAKLDISPLSPVGIKASAMTAAQRDLLMKLLDAYAGLMTPDIAADRLGKIKTAGIENVTFAWAGPVERGQKHYYRVQGPTFLIELDNTQNNGNHIHSVWRDFNGDFGRDLLREHLRSTTHE